MGFLLLEREGEGGRWTGLEKRKVFWKRKHIYTSEGGNMGIVE